MTPVKDLDHDGIIDADEIAQSKLISDIEHEDEKFDTQKKMVWATFISMIAFIAILCSPFLSDARVTSLTLRKRGLRLRLLRSKLRRR